jgi:hypothetical protein
MLKGKTYANLVYQISNICNLNRIVNYISSRAAISFVEHCFVDDNSCFYVFRCITNVSLESSSTILVFLINKAS